MTTSRTMLALLLTATCLVIALPAAAQSPYDPVDPAPQRQITDGVFEESPLQLPFREIGVERVAPDSRRSSDDFRHTYAISYDEVVAYFEDTDQRAKGYQVLDAAVFPQAKGIALKVIAMREDGEGGHSILLQNVKLGRRVKLTLRPDSGGRATVTFHNIVLTSLASGVMPARTGFLGIHIDEELPFNWN